MSDIEPLLGRAFAEHGDQITQESLHRPLLAVTADPGRRPRVRIALAAAAVVAVSATAGLITGRLTRDGGLSAADRDRLVAARRAPEVGPLPTTGVHRYVGRRWGVVAVDFRGTRLEVAPGRRAVLVFGRTGGLTIDDTVNHGYGGYTLTARGFRVDNWATTWVAAAGDPGLEAQLRALALVEGAVAPGRDADDTVVSWVGNRLVLTNGGYRLELVEDRIVSATPGASATG